MIERKRNELLLLQCIRIENELEETIEREEARQSTVQIPIGRTLRLVAKMIVHKIDYLSGNQRQI